MDGIKVTIFCLTYNHSAYIREALEGFLNQKTNFPYNILVFDDASTDGTSEILRDYQQRYPDIINLYVSPENTYGKAERRDILNKLYESYVLGEYVAWCEGDDAWTDCCKLQMQVDYMDKHPECMMTTHAFRVIDYSDGKEILRSFGEENRIISKEEIILQPHGNLGTASLVMRKKVFLRNDGFPVCDVEDYPMQLCAIWYGDIYYFNREMSLYRHMHEGSWCKQSEDDVEKAFYHKLGFVQFLMQYDDYSKQKFAELIWNRIITYLYSAVFDLCRTKVPKQIVQNIINKSGNKYNSLISCIDKVYEWMAGTHRVNENVRQYIRKFEYVYIMGLGNYSKYIVNGLEQNDIDYMGFLLSKKENRNYDEQVWSVDDYPYDKSKTLVIVGISQGHEKDIVNTLKANNFKNVLYPLWFAKEEVGYES